MNPCEVFHAEFEQYLYYNLRGTWKSP